MNAPPNHDRTAPALRDARVLVVEDDFFIAMALQTMLTEAGAKAVPLCATVSEALSYLHKDELSAAILDIRLGRQSVVPVARELASRKIPFLFYTGTADTGHIEQEWPGSPVVRKPAMPQTIIDALERLLERDDASSNGHIAVGI